MRNLCLYSLSFAGEDDICQPVPPSPPALPPQFACDDICSLLPAECNDICDSIPPPLPSPPSSPPSQLPFPSSLPPSSALPSTSPPPPSPSPSLAPPPPLVTVVTNSFTLDTTVDAFDADTFKANLAAAILVPAERITLRVAAGSIVVHTSIEAQPTATEDSLTVAEQVVSSLQTLTSSTSDASITLGTRILSTTQPVIQTVAAVPPSPPPPSPPGQGMPSRPPPSPSQPSSGSDSANPGGSSLSPGILVVFVVTGLAVVMVLAMAAFFCMRRKPIKTAKVQAPVVASIPHAHLEMSPDRRHAHPGMSPDRRLQHAESAISTQI